jgi:hypothetical protein
MSRLLHTYHLLIPITPASLNGSRKCIVDVMHAVVLHAVAGLVVGLKVLRGWEATVWSQMGGLEAGLALWRVGDNDKSDMGGGLEVTVRVLWGVKDFAMSSIYT